MVKIEPITHIINGEYIREWLVLGPFLPDDLGKDFLVNVGGEANVQPEEGNTVSTSEGETLTWKHHISEADVVDPLAAIGNYEYATAYAFCIMQSENAGDVKIYLGSDDGVAVWINGEEVHSNDVDRSLSLDQDTFCADLKAGANRCLVKVCNITRSWEFAMRVLPTNRAVVFGTISDEAGAPILNANVRLEQDETEIAQTTTDNSGSYRLDIYPARGTYELSATGGNLGNRQLGIQLGEGERQKLDLTLKEEINIEGILLMLDDMTPHVAVPVQVIRDGEVAATVLSNEAGRYQFINLKPGSYQVRCQVLGGYIYYGEEKAGKPESRTMSDNIDPLAHESIDLRVEQGRTIRNIDFRFAPFKKGTWRKYRVMDGLTHDFVYDIYRDPDGVMWFGTDGCGLSRYDGRTFTNFTIKDGLAGNSVTDIHCDPDGIMWFGTKASGVSIYDGRTFVNLTTEDGLASNRVSAIHQDPDGIMWFGTADGVSRYDGETFVSFTTKDGLPHNNVWTIHQDSDGAMWFGTGGGVSRYDGKRFVNLTTRDGLVHNSVNAIHRDPDGVMWFGTYGGVSRYDRETFVSLAIEDGLLDNNVITTCQDSDGVMWFGTRGGASRYDGREFVSFPIGDGFIYGHGFTIYTDSDDVLWFGTIGGGLSRYDGQTSVHFTREDGFVQNSVYDIHQDPDGVMWFGTAGGGVAGYDGVAWTLLDERDGLPDNKVWSIDQDADGSLWFATRGGISCYRPSKTPPKAHIVSVTADKTYGDLSALPSFTTGTRITIQYGALDLKTIPEKRQYRCRVYETGDMRLETGDKRQKEDVSNLKSDVSCLKSDVPYNPPTRNTTFDWTPEKPGTYVFEVQAIDRDLNYSEPASVQLEMIPDPRNHQIAQLKGELAERERAELERVYQELKDARQIQQSLLPDSLPEIEGFEIAATSLPAREVSGDFYNYLLLGNSVGIVLADVTGKSVKAAMVAALTDGMLSEALNAQREFWNSPSKMLRRLSIGIRPRLIRGMYTAMSLGIIQPEKKRLIFSNAGMPYPIVKRGNEVQELEVNGMPLGLMDEAKYQDLSLDLEKGDLVIFYSDGVIEAENEAEEMYQTERLLESIHQANPGISAQEMVNLVVKDVTAFVSGEEASDDITIVVLRYKE